MKKKNKIKERVKGYQELNNEKIEEYQNKYRENN